MLLHGGANNLISLVIRALSEYVNPQQARQPLQDATNCLYNRYIHFVVGGP